MTRPSSQLELSGSPYHVSEELKQKVKITDGKGKQKSTEEPARSEILRKYSEAEALLKRVYVQHPNYDHIIEAILDVGLEGLNRTVVLSIGVFSCQS